MCLVSQITLLLAVFPERGSCFGRLVPGTSKRWPGQSRDSVNCHLFIFFPLPLAFPPPHLHSFLSLPSLFCFAFNSYLNQNCLLLSIIKTQTALQDFLQIVSPQLHLSPASFHLQAITFNSFNGFFGNFTVSLNNMLLLLLPGVSVLDISYYILTSHYRRWRFTLFHTCTPVSPLTTPLPLPMDYFFPPSSSSNIIILVS